jgi:putative MATE family efflux protein
MNAYGLTDAYFVGKLGTLPLAAMAFAIPVVMLLSFLAGGLGSGVTILMSHALGRGDKTASARLVSDGIVLTAVAAVVLAVAGYLSMDWLFARLGADAQTMPLIRAYMSVWYLGALFMAMPMMGNGLLIASGDSAAASGRMILGAGLNAILNPLLIHGYLGMPALGIRGSALATVIAQAVSTVWLFWLLHHRHQLLKWNSTQWSHLLISFRSILRFAIPGMMSMMLMPIASSTITWLLSRFGNEVVAASGVAGRIEMVAFIIPMALGISLTPFVSQNFGAQRIDRVREAFRISTRFALLYGAAMTVLYFIFAPRMASFFTADSKVASTLTAYLRITSIGYGMTEVHRYCTFFLTGLHKPLHSLVLDAVRVLILLAPLAYLFSRLMGVNGIFWGRVVTDVTAGLIGMLWVIHTRQQMTKAAQMKDEVKIEDSAAE